MQTPEPAIGPEGRTGTDWNASDWRTADRNVRNLRHRIFKATSVTLLLVTCLSRVR
jgi:hypothetical protein